MAGTRNVSVSEVLLPWQPLSLGSPGGGRAEGTLSLRGKGVLKKRVRRGGRGALGRRGGPRGREERPARRDLGLGCAAPLARRRGSAQAAAAAPPARPAPGHPRGLQVAAAAWPSRAAEGRGRRGCNSPSENKRPRSATLTGAPGRCGPLPQTQDFPRPGRALIQATGSSRLVKAASAAVPPAERPRNVRASTAHEARLANSLRRSLALWLMPRARQPFCARATALPAPPPRRGRAFCARADVLPRLPLWERAPRFGRDVRVRGAAPRPRGWSAAQVPNGSRPHPGRGLFVTTHPVHCLFTYRIVRACHGSCVLRSPY